MLIETDVVFEASTLWQKNKFGLHFAEIKSTKFARAQRTKLTSKFLSQKIVFVSTKKKTKFINKKTMFTGSLDLIIFYGFASCWCWTRNKTLRTFEQTQLKFQLPIQMPKARGQIYAIWQIMKRKIKGKLIYDKSLNSRWKVCRFLLF